jgi:hypothetical protein
MTSYPGLWNLLLGGCTFRVLSPIFLLSVILSIGIDISAAQNIYQNCSICILIYAQLLLALMNMLSIFQAILDKIKGIFMNVLQANLTSNDLEKYS